MLAPNMQILFLGKKKHTKLSFKKVYMNLYLHLDV